MLAVLLAGCATMKKSGGSGKGSASDDPLLGGTAPPPAVQGTPLASNPAVASPPGALGRPTSGTEPLAQPTVSSPAVLATGAYPPLPGGQDLRIGTPPPTVGGNRVLPRSQTPPGVLAVVTADPNHGQPGTANEAVPGVVPLDAAGQPTLPTPTGGGGLDQALAAVAAMSPKWHRLEGSSPGTWRFSCSIPDKQEPTKSRTYEAEGATALAAVQQVLERINRGQ